jgi:FMN phosphatase YigB (HAD superfamily)
MTGSDTRPYLLLDAGGILLLPDPHVLAEVSAEMGLTVDPEVFSDGHYRFVHRLDSARREDARDGVLGEYEYFIALLTGAGLRDDQLLPAGKLLWERDQQRCIWSYCRPWVDAALAALTEAGYRMSVVSNSDGRVQHQLEDVGLVAHFEEIFDSGIVGVEKPDPRFFHHALKHLGLGPSDVLYLGDIYHIDVLGANRAGIGAVHVDPLKLYDDWPGVHIPDLRAYPRWLAENSGSMEEMDLFPLASEARPDTDRSG